jgi:hypothetical protein
MCDSARGLATVLKEEIPKHDSIVGRSYSTRTNGYVHLMK